MQSLVRVMAKPGSIVAPLAAVGRQIGGGGY
jgi:hypothetical protein